MQTGTRGLKVNGGGLLRGTLISTNPFASAVQIPFTQPAFAGAELPPDRYVNINARPTITTEVLFLFVNILNLLSGRLLPSLEILRG